MTFWLGVLVGGVGGAYLGLLVAALCRCAGRRLPELEGDHD